MSAAHRCGGAGRPAVDRAPDDHRHRAGRHEAHRHAGQLDARPARPTPTSGWPMATRSPEPPIAASSRRRRSSATSSRSRSRPRPRPWTPGTATSTRTGDVAPGELVLSDRPTITGTPQVDTQLSATHGTWSPQADFTYQWSAGGSPVDGAVDSTFTPSAEQLGQRVSVTVTAQRDGYTTATSRSVLTGAVHRASFATTGPPVISGTARSTSR